MDLRRTNWNLYKSFIVAYETKNLHKAADILDMTRSAVGQNIKELGNQLGVILFNSHRKGIEPTGEAHTLYPEIKNAVQSILQAEQNIKTFDAKTTSSIKIAVQSLVVELYIGYYMKEFCTKYPNVDIDFWGSSGVDLLEQRKIDFVINYDRFFAKTNFRKTHLFSLNYVFIATKEFLSKHNLTTRISLEDLLKLQIIAYREAWADFINLVNPTVQPNVIETEAAQSTYAIAKNSVGIGYINKEFFHKFRSATSNLVILDVNGINIPTYKYVCAYNNLTRPARAFIEGFTAFIQSCCN